MEREKLLPLVVKQKGWTAVSVIAKVMVAERLITRIGDRSYRPHSAMVSCWPCGYPVLAWGDIVRGSCR
jgi:hypothetical protein